VEAALNKGQMPSFFKETRKRPVSNVFSRSPGTKAVRYTKAGERYDIYAHMRTNEPKPVVRCAHLPALTTFHGFLREALRSDLRVNVNYIGEKVKGKNVLQGATIIRLPKKINLAEAQDVLRSFKKQVDKELAERQRAGKVNAPKYLLAQQLFLATLKQRLGARVRFVPMPGFTYSKFEMMFVEKPKAKKPKAKKGA
jgi:hypothetical protein